MKTVFSLSTKTTARLLAGAGAGLLLAAGTALAVLVCPGTPTRSPALRFVGYVPLPSKGLLNVLDYLTVDGDWLFVAGASAGNVCRVPLRGSGLPRPADLAVLPGSAKTHGVAVDPVGRRAFVTRGGTNTVDVFDPATMRLVGSIPVADDPDAILYDPQNKLVYVAGGEIGIGTLIDPATQTVVGSVALGGSAEFAVFDPQTRCVFQNLHSTDEVVAVDLARRAVVGRWPLAGCRGPSGLALDASKRKLFVGGAENSRVAVFDLDSHRVVATQPVGANPDSVAFDPGRHRVYTTGRAGVTTVLDEDPDGTLRVVDTVHTHYGAHTLAVDPVTHRVYVGYAGLLAAPRLAVFEARP